MYNHVLVPVDCSPDTRRAASEMAAFLVPLVPCQVTLVAATSPSTSEEQRRKKADHAREALKTIGDILFEIGVYSRQRLVEGVEDGDLAIAVRRESRRPGDAFDLILLGTHHTRQEDYDQPCIGSIADRIAGTVKQPILILPTRLSSKE